MKYNHIQISTQNLDSVYEQYKDSIIIGIVPHYNIQQDKGECHIVMIYKNHKKYLVKECSNIYSPHKCAILGMQMAAEQIKIAKPIVLLATSHFGLKKALKNKGKHVGEWREVVKIIEEKGCPSITEIFVDNGKQQLNKLCTQQE